jgi:hypothetical protein
MMLGRCTVGAPRVHHLTQAVEKEAQAGERADDSGETAAVAIPTVDEKGTAGE